MMQRAFCEGLPLDLLAVIQVHGSFNGHLMLHLNINSLKRPAANVRLSGEQMV